MTTESIQFFGFFAAVFVFCAVAEWMFAVEAVKYARRRNLGKGMRQFLAAVVISDGLSIILNIVGWCLEYATINGGWLIGSAKLMAELHSSVLLSPLFSPITFFVVALAGPLVEVGIPVGGPLVLLLTLPMGLLSFASPIMRAKVMWKADWRSCIRLLFVVYATFLPASLACHYMNGR